MKKRTFTLILFSIICFLGTFAQETNGYYKKKLRTIGFTNTTLSLGNTPNLKSNYGASLTVGRTYYLHKKPIAKMLRFGIDAIWSDLNYANYKIEHITYWETSKIDFHQLDISLQTGPSIVLNPVGKLNIHTYFRYAPTLSMLFSDEKVFGNKANCFVGGGIVSYGAIGIGVESRSGKCKYKEFVIDDEEENIGTLNTEFEGWRVFLTFKF